MGDRRSMPLSARERYYKRRLRRMRRLAFASLCLTVFICASMAYPVFAPASSLAGESPVTANLEVEPPATQTPVITPEPEATAVVAEKTVLPLPTQGQIVPPVKIVTFYITRLPATVCRWSVCILAWTSRMCHHPKRWIPRV